MNNKRGFTLLEVLVVIAIIAIIVAFAVTNFVGARQRARDVRKKSELQQMKSALRLYYNDFNIYPGPASASTNDVNGCGADSPPTLSCQDTCAGAFANGGTNCSTVYMKLLPQLSDYTWKYQQMSLGDDYCLWASLENVSDGEIAKSQTRCSNVCGSLVGSEITAGTDYVMCAD